MFTLRPAPADVGRAVDDDDELVPRGALVRQRRARRDDRTRRRSPATSSSSRFEQPAKSGTRCDQLDLRVLSQHRPILRGGGRAGQASTVQCPHGQRHRRADRRRRSQPDRQEERDALAHPRRRSLGPGRERPRRAATTSIPAQIEDLQWGCVTQVDEQAWNIGRNVALTAGWPVIGLRHDRRPPVRLVDADELQRRRRGVVGAARPRHLRRRRDDVARPDGLEPRLDVRRRAPSASTSSCRASRPRRSRRSGSSRARSSTGTRYESHARAARAHRRGALREGDHPDRPRRARRRDDGGGTRR